MNQILVPSPSQRSILGLTAFVSFAWLALAATPSFAALSSSNDLTNLRSAALMRATDRLEISEPIDENRTRELLRAHFRTVEAELLLRTDESLDLAIARIEDELQRSLSQFERGLWRTALSIQRRLQIKRLRAYSLRGVFPQNEEDPLRSRPIFVDNHDTACAVGHLIRMSGNEDLTASIARGDNYVYVPDVSEIPGALRDWILVSGLTAEEAALIQPTYPPPPSNATFEELLTSSLPFVRQGLSFDHFSYTVPGSCDHLPSDTLCAAFCEANPAACNFGSINEPVDLGLSVHDGPYDDFPNGGEYSNPIGDRWIFIGGERDGDSFAIPFATPGDPLTVRISYDVTAPAGMAFDGFHATFLPFFNSNENFDPFSFRDRFRTVVSPSVGIVSSLEGNSYTTVGPNPSYFWSGTETAFFAPSTTINVVSEFTLYDTVMNSFIHEFDLIAIPEPGSAFLMISAFSGLAFFRRIRR